MSVTSFYGPDDTIDDARFVGNNKCYDVVLK